MKYKNSLYTITFLGGYLKNLSSGIERRSKRCLILRLFNKLSLVLKLSSSVLFLNLLLFFIFKQNSLQAQVLDTKGVISPPEVNTNFMKTLHTGINYQNGNSNLKIPLFSLPVEDNFSIPIELTYDGSGVKYGQPSGEVGVGWNISCNFRVSRTVYNRPDEFFVHPAESEINSIIGMNKYKRDQYLTRFTFGLPTNGGQDLRNNETVLDGEYDIFDYATPFLSGSFVIKDIASKSIISSDNLLSKFDFTLNNEGIRSFTMRDSKGNNIIAGLNPGDGNYLTEFVNTYPGKKTSYAWPITQVRTLNGRQVDFNYVSETINEGNFSGDRAVRISEGLAGRPYSTSVDDYNDGTSAAKTTYLTESIKSDHGLIKIFRSGSAKMIDSLILYDNNSSIVKKAIFSYSYTLGYRLLDSVTISGEDGVVIQRFTLTYYGRDAKYLTPDIWGNLRLPGGDESEATYIRFPKELSNETYLDYQSGSGGDQVGNIVPLSKVISNFADRSPRGIPDFLSLKTITAPGGGYLSYEYDANYYYSGGKKQGPGIRVSKVTNFDRDNKKLLETNYTYGQNNDGIGEIPIEMTSNFFGLDQVIFERALSSVVSFYVRNLRTFSNVPIVDSDPFFSRYNMVFYPVVKESTGAGTTVYYYTNNSQGFWATTRPFGPAITDNYKMWAKPTLTKTEVLDKNGNLKRSEELNYGQYFGETLYGIKVKPYVIFSEAFTPPTTAYSYDSEGKVNSIYDYSKYAIHFGTYSLTNKTVTEKNESGTIISKTTYEFDKNNQLIKEFYYGSDSIYNEIQYSYANNLQNLTANDSITQDLYMMQNNNFVDDWIERRYLKKDPLTNKLSTTHAQFRSYFKGSNKVRNLFNFNLTQGMGEFYQAKVLNSKISIDSKYIKDRFLTKDIDKNGNITSLINEKGVEVIYLWAGNGMIPIAEIINTNYAEVVAILTQSVINQISSSTVSDVLINNVIKKLRADSRLFKSKITSYTFKPLIGVTSITDPQGITQYYDYDSFGRLILVRDHIGNILKRYCYNYAGMPTDCTKIPTVYKNDKLSKVFRKNDCGAGILGSEVTYVVEEGKYTSLKKDEPNLMAQRDMQENGQNYANTHGQCKSIPYVALVKENITSEVIDPENAEEQYIEEERGSIVLYFYKDSQKKELLDNVDVEVFYDLVTQPDMSIPPNRGGSSYIGENGAFLFDDVPLVRRHYYKDGSGTWNMHPPIYNIIKLLPSNEYYIIN